MSHVVDSYYCRELPQSDNLTFMRYRLGGWVRPIAFIVLLLAACQFAVSRSSTHLLPGPWETLGGVADLVRHGLLLKYITASLFRVTWGLDRKSTRLNSSHLG